MVKYTWDHIHLRTANPEATAQWYERMLGAEVIRTMQQGKPRIDLKLGGANIFIAPVAPGDGVNPPPVTPYQGLDHFGLTVSGIDAVVAELKAKGVEFTRDPTTVRPGVRVAFLRAPEGVSLRLVDRNAAWADEAANASGGGAMDDKRFAVTHTDEEWRRLLTPEQYQVLRGHGTEAPGSCALNYEKRSGTFVCAGCGQSLFVSKK